MKLLVFNPGDQGGIVKYAWHQAEELARLGCSVDVLCEKQAEPPVSRLARALLRLIPDQPANKRRGKLARRSFLIRQHLGNQVILFYSILVLRPDVVLLAGYSEFLSPVWVWLQLAASKLTGVMFTAVLHDPVRNLSIGPAGWHRLSVKLAYWPLAALFVHQKPPPEAGVPARLPVYQVPHGLFPLGKASVSREAFRSRWGIPEEAVVFLSFGFIRDAKNIDLLIRALPDNPAAYLMVAGRVQSQSANRPVEYYEALARKLGVERRVKFTGEFVPEEEIPVYFHAADVAALSYSGSFRSQSGVLNIAANVDKPILASSGPGPLKSCVDKFQLGEFVAPDDAQALSDGMAKLCGLVQAQRTGSELPREYPRPDWHGYRNRASWRDNARIFMKAISAPKEAAVSSQVFHAGHPGNLAATHQTTIHGAVRSRDAGRALRSNS